LKTLREIEERAPFKLDERNNPPPWPEKRLSLKNAWLFENDEDFISVIEFSR
jgi:hypothetical protein